MKPEVDQILNLSAAQLLAATVPLLPNNYSQGSTSLLAIMMMFSAQEYERGADIRARDNADMRVLFGELAPHVPNAPLRAELDRAARTMEISLLISELDRSNAELRKLLIRVQIHFEEQNDEIEQTAAGRIWDVLRASADRRLLKPPGA
jgi:hypothetical protein